MEPAAEGVSDDDILAEACAADGDSTDAESENGNDDLNVHHFIADLEAELDELNKRRADLDHLDSMGIFSSAEDGQEAADDDAPEEALPALDPEEDSSDDEEDAVEPQQEAGDRPALKRPRMEQQQPLPGAKRLWYKQPPPAAYLQLAAAPSKKVLKRPGMLKRPAGNKVPESKLCRGRQDLACRFCPQSPGHAARTHPDRGIHQCIFCSDERMRQAHAAQRQGLFLFFAFCTARRVARNEGFVFSAYTARSISHRHYLMYLHLYLSAPRPPPGANR